VYSTNVDGGKVGIAGKRFGADPTAGYSIDVAGGMLRFILGNGGIAKVASGGTIVNNTWYHVVGSISGTNMTAYVNGVLVGTTTFSGTRQNPNADLYIGRFYDTGSSSTFSGTIDEFVIANRSLSASEVSAHYLAGRAKHADWDPNGKWNGAMKFDGLNDYVAAGSGIQSYPYNNLAISVWAYLTRDSTNEAFVASGITSGIAWVVRKTSSNKLNIEYWGTGGYRTTSTSSLPSLNAWHHFVFTMESDATTSKIYVDGVVQSTLESVDTLTGSCTSCGMLQIGRQQAVSNTNYFNGSIDEVRIWNRALSVSEVRQQYYSSLNKFAPDRWLFVSNQTGLPAGTHSYYLYANGADGSSDYSDERVLRVS